MNESDLLAVLSLTMKRLAPYNNRESAMLPALFIAIAQEPGCTCRHLMDKFGVHQSAISKATRALGDGMDKHKRRRKWLGHGLVQGIMDKEPTEPAAKNHRPKLRYYLTEKGQQVLNEIHAELNHRLEAQAR